MKIKEVVNMEETLAAVEVPVVVTEVPVVPVVVSELDKWKALLASAKSLAGDEETQEVAVIKAKVDALEAEVIAKEVALDAEIETVESEVVTGVAVLKTQYGTVIHNALNTIGIAVVLLKLFGII